MWVINFDGLILHSPNQGQTWTQQYADTANRLTAIHFADNEHGWTVGRGGTVLATSDGGNTWTPQNSGTRDNFSSVHFADPLNGWIVGGEGTVLATSDGSNTWTPQDSGTRDNFSSVHFTDPLNGWIVGKTGTILATSDGGNTWTPQDSGTREDFSSVHFADRLHGWIVGEAGTILATSDGGNTWTPHNGGTLEDFFSVHFADPLNGWIVGRTGTILATSDGGNTWTPQDSGIRAILSSVHFADRLHGWVIGMTGTILATSDGGNTWQHCGQKALHSVHFIDLKNGWAVGANGTILGTSDGGNTWKTQSSGTDADLSSVYSTGLQHGWIVGEAGTILATTDGGNTWTLQGSGAREDFTSVHFTDPQHGWIVGWGSPLLTTTNGGNNWTQNSELSLDHQSVYFTDPLHGWTVGTSGTILTTSDGGNNWTPQSSGTNRALLDLHFTNRQHGWIVGSSGTILTTSDGGNNWTTQNSGTDEALLDLHFTDPQHGWSVGDVGTILTTSNGGNNWTPQSSGTNEWLTSVHFTDPQHGWSVGWGGTILTTSDGGNTWPAVAYSRWPAPWYYLALLACSLLLTRAVRHPLAEQLPTRSVADRLISDRPLSDGDPDALSFRPLALGISRFFRNRNTQPPVTLAVTGAWGSGKSSIMNLVQADLESFGFFPVWFNAWHHQKEEHLLASLLEAVRRQAVPPPWRPEAWAFRSRLLRIRGWRYWLPLLLLAMALAFAIALVARDDAQALEEVATYLRQLPEDGALPWPGFGDLAGVAVLATSLVGILAALGKALRSFGADPAKLLASGAEGLRIGRLRDKISFRQKFAEQFRDVTRALAPRRMVIFIDDLDRCRPENVLLILEAVNFLVSSGDCFVVLGLSRDQVEAAVGLGFKEIADEIVELEQEQDAAGEDLAEQERRKRREFAKQYLEKLINLEIPVPTPSEAQSRKLLVGEPEPAELPSPAEVWGKRLLRGLKPLGAATLVLLGLGAAFSAGWFFPGAPPPAQEVANNPTTPTVVSGGGEESSPVEVQTAPEGPEEAPGEQPSSASPAFIPGQPSTGTEYLLLIVVALALAATGGWILTRRPGAVVDDSPGFTRALELWHPIIVRSHLTPRRLKLFLNRLRYLAMRQRPETQELPIWRRLAQPLARRFGWDVTEPVNPPQVEPIPEDLLVVLAALESLDPDLLASDKASNVAFLTKHPLLRQVIEDHRIDRDLKDPATFTQHRAAYLEMIGGIRTSPEPVPGARQEA